MALNTENPLNERNRLLRIDLVCKLTGIPKSSIYVLLNQGSFPRPVQISSRCIAFVEKEVLSWINLRIQERDATSNTAKGVY